MQSDQAVAECRAEMERQIRVFEENSALMAKWIDQGIDLRRQNETMRANLTRSLALMNQRLEAGE